MAWTWIVITNSSLRRCCRAPLSQRSRFATSLPHRSLHFEDSCIPSLQPLREYFSRSSPAQVTDQRLEETTETQSFFESISRRYRKLWRAFAHFPEYQIRLELGIQPIPLKPEDEADILNALGIGIVVLNYEFGELYGFIQFHLFLSVVFQLLMQKCERTSTSIACEYLIIINPGRPSMLNV